jgi:hypothetical protein
MPLTNAEKQRRYRERHLGPDGDKVRLTSCVSIAARDQLDRLSWHLGYNVTELIEELAAAAERHVEAKLTGAALKAYRDAGCEDTA